jgi:putative transcriptional regulator
MTTAFESIAQGLREAIALTQGEPIEAKSHRAAEIDVAQLRRSLGLTQMAFAAKFHISIGTLRHWERGDRTPHGPALALLHVVAKEPQAVLRALG